MQNFERNKNLIKKKNIMLSESFLTFYLFINEQHWDVESGMYGWEIMKYK